jgi:TonB family protein
MRKINLIFIFFALYSAIYAQVSVPVKWSFSTKQIDKQTIEVRFSAAIENGWYIYDMDMPEGGLLPTRFFFETVKGCNLIGKTETETKVHTEYDSIFEMAISWYEGNPVFIQKLKITDANQFSLSGYIGGLSSCNNKTVIPFREEFSFDKTHLFPARNTVSQCDIYKEKADAFFKQKKYEEAKRQYSNYKECKSNAKGIDEKIALCDCLLSGKSMDECNATATDNNDIVFETVEKLPEFSGGETGLMQYLSENIKYPALARESGIQGTVVVRFIVETDGSVSNVVIQRGLSPYTDREVVRVVKSMPRWKPGEEKSKPVRVYYNLPVSFKFSNESTTPTGSNSSNFTPSNIDWIKLLKRDLAGRGIREQADGYFGDGWSWKVDLPEEIQNITVLNETKQGSDYVLDIHLLLQAKNSSQYEADVKVTYVLGENSQWKIEVFQNKDIRIVKTGRYDNCSTPEIVTARRDSGTNLQFTNNCDVNLIIGGQIKGNDGKWRKFACTVNANSINSVYDAKEYRIDFVEKAIILRQSHK